MRGKLSDYRDLHHGELIVVCGTGRSLNLEAFDNLLGIDDNRAMATTIGVNDVYKAYSTDYLLILDRLVKFSPDRREAIQDGCRMADAVFLPYEADVAKVEELSFANPVHFEVELKEPFMSTKPDLHMERLFVAITAPYTAVVLAAYMGAKRIGLIGVDFHGHELAEPENLREVELDYAGLAEACETDGILLRNLSPDSLLCSVRKSSFQDLMDLPLP